MTMKRNEQFMQGMFQDSGEVNMPARDLNAVKQVVVAVTDSLYSLRDREGTVVFPRPLHSRDQHALRVHGSGIGNRIGFMVSIPLGEGVGTLIEIRARRK